MKSLCVAVILLTAGKEAIASDFVFSPPVQAARSWLGPEVWANPMPDWRLEAGEMVCDFSGGNRNVVILTHELTSTRKAFRMRVTVQQLSEKLEPRGGWAGFQVGLQGRFADYRDSAVFGRGVPAGIHFGGRLFIADTMDRKSAPLSGPFKDLTLELTGEPEDSKYRLELRAFNAHGEEVGRIARKNVDASWLEGLVAITDSTTAPGSPKLNEPRPEFKNVPAMETQRGGSASMAFKNFSVSGGKFAARPERAFGPILWTQHSLQNNGTLKLMAQLPPLGDLPLTVSLELDGKPTGMGLVEPASGTALFRIEHLDPRRQHDYRIRLNQPGVEKGEFSGQIRPLPLDRHKVTVAAFSCNDGTGFPHNSLVANVEAQKPDLLIFLGDQIYEGNGGYGVLFSAGKRSILDYLRKYYLHGWAWRELLRNIPSATIPDDHDVFHGNLWGNGGRAVDTSRGFWAEAQDQGGYKMPPEFVNVVHRTQAGNLPDPFDPKPCDQGISVYYTSWAFGPLDFAIVADRQWKTAPAPLLPAADILNGFVRNEQWDPRTQASNPMAQLLGARQENFLQSWASNRPPEAKFRVVVSQTPWNCMATLPEGQHRSDKVVPRLPIPAPGEYPENDVPTIDFDSNGWPKEKRDLALRTMNSAGVLLHIAGDQHLGSTGRYGIDQWDDGPYWLATPAIANLWPRRWFPPQPGGNHKPGAPRYTGRYEDQFGNKITVLAAANPRKTERNLPVQISDRAPGYSIVHFDTVSETATLENWPYWASPAREAPDNKPYEGWPVVIRMK